MTTFIALLRGINVGGHNIIKMEDLRAICSTLKFQQVQTYVQSGNVVFQAKDDAPEKLAAKLESAIEKSHGFRPSVICRTASELEATAARNPYAGRTDIDPRKLGVGFLATQLSAEARAKLLQLKPAQEELHIGIQELFIYFPEGMGKSKLSMAAVERTAKTAITVRNWSTVTNLIEMAREKD